MRAMLLAAMLLIGPATSHADAVDDVIDEHMACLIGHAAVALLKQEGKRDADPAQEVAYGICKEPKELASIDGDPGDYVNVAVMALVEGVWGE